MSRGPADDDDVPIEITPDILEGPVESGPVATGHPAGPGRPGTAAAAEMDPRAEIELYLAEAALAGAEGGRAAPLLHEAAHLQASALGDHTSALATHREALARDATFVATLAPLRQLLSARGAWDELAVVYERLIRGGAFGADARRSRRVADLWVERGRILEDRLARPLDAASGYREAMVSAPDHATVPLARLLGAARAQDSDGVEAALAGLIDCTEDPTRRAALAAELARAQRRAPAGHTPVPSVDEPADEVSFGAADGGQAGGSAEGPLRALDTLRQALAGLGDEAASADLRDELEELESELARHKELEQALRNTLLSAERMADDMRAQARREADVIVAEARSAARDIVSGAESERERIHTEIRRLKDVETGVRADYRAFLLAALDRLESDTEERKSAHQAA